MSERKWWFWIDAIQNRAQPEVIIEQKAPEEKLDADDIAGWDGPYDSFTECKNAQVSFYEDILKRIRRTRMADLRKKRKVQNAIADFSKQLSAKSRDD